MSDSTAFYVMDPSIPLPRLYAAALPEAERICCDQLNGLLSEIDSYVRDFFGALELFDHSLLNGSSLARPAASLAAKRKYDLMRLWKFIAAKDGAMTLYHFGETLDAIRGGLRGCQILQTLVDTDSLKEADKRFDKAFPNYVKLRHSVAHQTVVAKTPYMAIRSSDGAGSILITGSLRDRHYSSTWNGANVEYELSEESLKTLAEIRDAIFKSFSNAATHLRDACTFPR